MIYLLLTFAYIAGVTIGGGYAMIPLIQEEAIFIHNWITEPEFINILAISQITPGAIAINSATFIGLKNYGILGAILASIGLILPSSILIFFIAPLLKKYEKNKWRIKIFSCIRPVVTGLIAGATFGVAKTTYLLTDNINIVAIGLTVVAFVLIKFAKLKPVFTLLLCGVAGLFLF